MKRWLGKLVLFLLLGAIVNVAVAWGCALRAPSQGHEVAISKRGATPAWALAERCEAHGCIRNRWECDLDRDVSLDASARNLRWTIRSFCGTVDSRPIHVIVPVSEGNPWSRLGSDESQQMLVMEEIAAGWPLPACWGALGCVNNHNQSQRSYGVIAIGPAVTHMGGIQYADTGLPLIPIWSGFAINAVFYAGLLCGLFAIPFALGGLRRRRRVKRGLCPKCAYPAGESAVCTECGTPLRHQSIGGRE